MLFEVKADRLRLQPDVLIISGSREKTGGLIKIRRTDTNLREAGTGSNLRHCPYFDINCAIIVKNAVINAARAAYERAKEELAEVMAIPVTVVKAFKSEIIDVIRKIAEEWI